MVSTYTNPEYPYQRSPDQDASTVPHHRVIIVGGGPAGLAAAMDLALQGIPTVLLDDNNTVSVGSRAICIAKRTLEICDRYGCASPMVEKGVIWRLGRVYFGEQQIYEFNLLPETDHKIPAFINLQQYYLEEYMVRRCLEFPQTDLRWLHKVTQVQAEPDRNLVTVDTREGSYQLSCDYLLVADGASSPIRESLGLESRGQVFEDRFLIADIVMKAEFPAERRFWFDAPFHPNQSTLLHKQADNVWRIDFQLGWDADPEQEKRIENIRPRVEAMLGPEREWELEWASVYTFRCRKMDSFLHRRVIFMGDAAHQVSPFGARGANGAIQGVENLCWKLAAVLQQQAPASLLTSYNSERQLAARENILHSSRATDFMTPKNRFTRLFRDTVLELARDYPFARSLVNSGRLSTPCNYYDSTLNSEDCDDFAGAMRPGSACVDAPIETSSGGDWWLQQLGNRFVLLLAGTAASDHDGKLQSWLQQLTTAGQALDVVIVEAAGTQPTAAGHIGDSRGILSRRYDLREGAAYLIRPDQYVCGRWRRFDGQIVNHALRRALGQDATQEHAA